MTRIFFIVLFVFGIAGVALTQVPDIILVNGKVFTAGSISTATSAIAIKGERISAVGSDADLRSLAGPTTRVIDLGERVVVPGFNDAHAHFGPNPKGIQLQLTDLEPTFAEVREKLVEAARSSAKGTWIFGSVGGSVINDPTATRAALDTLASENPVVLETYFGHGMVLNSAALKRLGVSENTKDPEGGRYERDANGALTGRVFEYVHWSLLSKIVAMTPDDELVAELRRRAATAASFGVTTMQVMPVIATRKYVKLLEKARLPIRTRAINFGVPDRVGRRGTSEIIAMSGIKPRDPNVQVSGIKWIIDGTPIERGAALFRDYLDRPGWSGAVNFPPRELESMVSESLRYKQPLLVHCVGDRGCSAVLDAMEKVGGKGFDWKAKRVRLEHGENVTGDMVVRAKRLGIVIVQNPTHFTDGEMGKARWGGGKSPIRSYLDAGIPFAIGSDGPINPFLNIMLASLHPDNPSQAITREQAVTAYTYGSAYAEFAEDKKGTIAPGKLADLAVLSQDIFSVPAGALPGTTSVLTLVGGKVVHDMKVLK